MEVDTNNIKFIWKHGINRVDIYNNIYDAVEAYCNTVNDCSKCGMNSINDGYVKFCFSGHQTKSLDDIKDFCRVTGMVACTLVETFTKSTLDNTVDTISLTFQPLQ